MSQTLMQQMKAQKVQRIADADVAAQLAKV
jgi:hypothetical protein